MDEEERRIAYFSMEMAIDPRMPTYSGGLGVLAGDMIRSFADLGVPAVGVTLLCNKGYFFQEIDDKGNQREEPVEWRTDDMLELVPHKVKVPIGDREVLVQPWKYTLKGLNGHEIPILFLDTNVEENLSEDREISFYLYGGDRRYRLKQEIVLGIGGVRVLSALGYGNLDAYHMNEGHTSLLTVELLKRCTGCKIDEEAIEKMKEKCVFTTHTPVPAGHDIFPKDLVKELLGNYFGDPIIDYICENGNGQNNNLNMTMLALHFSHYVNGVARKHAEVSRGLFPEYPIDSITNGVHHVFWAAEPFKRVYDKYIQGWKIDPCLLRAVTNVPDEEIKDGHFEAKKKLINRVNKMENTGMDYDIFTIGIARRFAKYKRPTLIFSDVERLKEIGRGKLQIVFSGKAHQRDVEGKKEIKRVLRSADELGSDVKIAFLENYDMELAKLIVSGVDLWLNTPRAPHEASGTSGMKAAINGVPSLSSLDGWWLEGHIENITGWSIGPKPEKGKEIDDAADAKDMYEKLEKVIMPKFYNEEKSWIKIMKCCIGINGSFFNSHRMVNQYLVKAYRSTLNQSGEHDFS